MYIERRFPWPWEVRIAAVVVILAGIAGAAWAGYSFYVSRVLKPKQYQQRRLYDEYFEQSVREFKPPDSVEGAEEYLADLKSGKVVLAKDLVDASIKRFGVHPKTFEKLPERASPYFAGVRK